MDGRRVLFEIRRIEDSAVHASLEDFVILRLSVKKRRYIIVKFRSGKRTQFNTIK